MLKCPQCNGELKHDASKGQVILESKLTSMKVYMCVKCNTEVKIYSNTLRKPMMIEIHKGH